MPANDYRNGVSALDGSPVVQTTDTEADHALRDGRRGIGHSLIDNLSEARSVYAVLVDVDAVNGQSIKTLRVLIGNNGWNHRAELAKESPVRSIIPVVRASEGHGVAGSLVGTRRELEHHVSGLCGKLCVHIEGRRRTAQIHA